MQFTDYVRVRREFQRRGQPFKTTDGKDIPSPSDVVTVMLRDSLKNDYAMRRLGEQAETGTVIQIMLADADEAKALAAHARFTASNGRPCTQAAIQIIEWDRHMALAKGLDLL
jgi:hypothetical protein